MDIGKNLGASFDLYTKNFGILFLAGLVVGLLSMVTLGILAGPLLGGFIVLCKKLLRGEKGEFNTVFAYVNQTGSLILLTVVMLVFAIITRIPVLGWLIGLIAGPVFGIMVTVVAGLAVEQNKSVQEGLKFAWDKAKASFLQFWIYGFVFGLIGCIGAILGFVFGLIGGIGPILCGIGALLTMPIAMIGMVLAYQSITADSDAAVPPVDNVGPSI